MKALVIASVVLSIAAVAGAGPQSSQSAAGGQNQNPPSSSLTPSPQSHPTRVRVKLEGFDLSSQSSKANQVGAGSPASPAPHTGANQVGGGSRGIGGVKLFAPEKGLAYSLYPTFQWSGSPDTKYKLVIEDLASHATYDVIVDGTSFTYPESVPPLKAGSTYSWTVQPELDLMGGRPEPVLIVIAGGPEREQIEAALAAVKQTGFEGDQARAQVYFDKRVWYDAAAAYSILISAHPDDRELHKMRGTLYDQVPATEKLADEDFAAAK
jgi:hypothetical protein